jgi:NADH-quinone oxidoreductase subunit N
MLKGKLEQIIDQLAALQMEMALISGALLLLLIGLITKKNTLVRAVFCLILLLGFYLNPLFTGEETILSNTLAVGRMESLIKGFLIVFTIGIVFFANAKRQTSEFYFLILSIVIGSVFMVSANHLLVVYIAIELTSFTSYIISNFNFQKRSFEAGLKYLLFGGVSSAIMLYGISILYGMSGSLFLDQMNFAQNGAFISIGIVALLGGLFFKLSLFPFHIWTPAVYEEAPTDAVAVLSIVPKIAGFVLLHRILQAFDLSLFTWIVPLVAVFGMITIVVGTLGALGQKNIKRLMAYGAIAHSGLILSSLLLQGDAGSSAFVWYVFIYAIMNLALFYIVSVFEEQGITTIEDFKGLGKKQPFFGVLILLLMISLVGLPPMAGFTAKFYLFTALWLDYQVFSDPYILAYLVLGVLSVVFALFYYLNIPYYYFIHSSDSENNLTIEFLPKLIATILVAALFWFFLNPQLLNNIISTFNTVEWRLIYE